MNDLTEQKSKDAIYKIVLIVKQILNSEVEDDLEIARKCVEIDHLRYEAELIDSRSDELFDIFGVKGIQDIFDDHGIPLRENVRQRWNAESLKKLDIELKEIIEFYKKDILENCKLILQKYGNN